MKQALAYDACGHALDDRAKLMGKVELAITEPRKRNRLFQQLKDGQHFL